MSVFEKVQNVVYTDSEGNVEAVQPLEKTSVLTSLGAFVPIYFVEDFGRKKLSPVKFYKNGGIKSLSLQESVSIETSIGTFSAELVTFYKNGALCRLFPLNGKLSGFWSEANEYKLAKTLTIPTPAGDIQAKPINLHFFETGELKSITFWPGEKVKVPTPLGEIVVRTGVSFHKNGAVASCEPLAPIRVKTSAGILEAFDPDPNGMAGDKNSLSFTEEGKIAGLSTVKSAITVINPEGEFFSFKPGIVRSLCNDDAYSLVPLRVIFGEDFVSFEKGMSREGSVPVSSVFKVEPFDPKVRTAVGCSD